MEDTLSRNQSSLHHAGVKGVEESALVEQQAQIIKRQEQKIQFLQKALQFELERIRWEQGETPEMFCQRFEVLCAPLQDIMTEEERVRMFKIRCPNSLRRFLVEIDVQFWTDVKKACELKTDMDLQWQDISPSTQDKIQHAQKLLQPHQNQILRTGGYVGTSLQPQPGDNRIGKHRQGTGTLSSLRRESQQSRRDSGRPNESKKVDKIMSCNNCKGEHKAVDCPGPQVCYYCYKEGHLRRNCPNRAVPVVPSSAEVPLFT